MRLLPLLLTATVLAAADTVPPKPAPAAGNDPVFEVRPGRLSMTRYRHWQNDGQRSNDQRQFELTMRFFAKGDATVLGWRDLKVTEAVSDAGEALELDRRSNERSGRVDPDMRRHDPDAAEFEVELSFAWPAKPCNGFAKLNGSVTALVAVGKPKKAELKPYKDVIGKTLEISGIPGGEIAIDKAEDGQGVTVRYPEALQDKIVGITFQDGSGKDLRMNGWGGGSGNGEIERTYRVRMPDDGVITMSIMPETKPVQVPFSVADLSFDGSTKGPRARVKVEAKDDVGPPKTKPDESLPVKPVGGADKF